MDFFCINEKVICVDFVVDPDVVVQWNGRYLASNFIYCVFHRLRLPHGVEVMKESAACASVIVVIETNDDMGVERKGARLALVEDTQVPAGHEAADVRRASHQ